MNEVICLGKIGQLNHEIKHFSFVDFNRYNQKLTQYSKLQAEVLFKKGKRPNLFHFLLRPSYRFFYSIHFKTLAFLTEKLDLY